MKRLRRVIVSQGVRSFLRKIKHEEAVKLFFLIESLSGDPFPSGSEKIPDSRSGFRINLGTFRVLYEVEGDTVRVEAIRSMLSEIL